MNIQVIIPVYKPDDKLIKLLEKLRTQTFVPTGINLVWSVEKKKNDPLLPRVIKRFPEVNISCVDVSEFDHGGTRRKAVEETKCDIFVMMTQDAVPLNNHLIENLITPMVKQMTDRDAVEPFIAAVYARQFPGRDSSPYEKLARLHNYPELSAVRTCDDIAKSGIKSLFCSDVCCAYRRDLYEEAGGFVPSTVFNEDMIIARKLLENGHAIRYEARAKVVHSHDYTAMQQLKRNFDLGVSQAMFPEVFGDIKSESEGVKFVTESVKLLYRKGAAYLIPGFCIQCGFKLIGYKLGRNYEKLPDSVIMKLTSGKSYRIIKAGRKQSL